MRSLDEGFQWHPATIWYQWYSASSLSMLAAIVLAALVGGLAARAVTIHSRNVSLSTPRLASLSDGRATQRIVLKGMKELPAESAAPAIWMPATLMETSRLDYAFPTTAVVPHKAGKRLGRTSARRKHVPSKVRSARRLGAGQLHMARPSSRNRVALSKGRRKIVLHAAARKIELARARKIANHRRARANRAKPASHRRQHERATKQHRRLRAS